MQLPIPDNFEAFGKLIEQWTLREETRPATEAELKAKLEAMLGPLPAWIKHVKIISSEDTLVVRLPPKQALQDKIDAINKGDSYTLPAFYRDRISDGEPPDNSSGNLRLFHMRLGDYTIAQCM